MKAGFGMQGDAEIVVPSGIRDRIGVRTDWVVECRDESGVLVWREEFSNLTVDEGLTDYLEVTYNSSNYTSSFFVGLANSPISPAPGDTLAVHPGWTEFSTYTGNRKALTTATAAAKQISTSAPSVFDITGTGTIAGMFICTVNSGAAGLLYHIANFTTGDKPVANGYTLNANATITAAAQ